MIMITSKYLRDNPNIIFVFGDNLIRKGKGGAASLRGEPNTYGFITKKYPSNKDSSFYTIEEYKIVFAKELEKLIDLIKSNPNKTFLISKLGSGLANKYYIYEEIIQPSIAELKVFHNAIIL